MTVDLEKEVLSRLKDSPLVTEETLADRGGFSGD